MTNILCLLLVILSMTITFSCLYHAKTGKFVFKPKKKVEVVKNDRCPHEL